MNVRDRRGKDLSYVFGAVVLTLSVACSQMPSDSADPSASPSPSPASFVNGGDCPPSKGSLPPDAGCVSEVVTETGVLTVYARVGRDDRPRSWHIRLESESALIDQALHAGNAYSYPRVVGASDVDEDGTEEWWVKVADFTSHGAPWSSLNLFFLDDDALIPLAFDKQPLGINYGGIARLGEGARCERGRLTLLRAEAQNIRNTRWKVSERSFAVAGPKARFLDRREGLLKIDDYNDPALDPYYEVDCAGFVFP